MTVIQLMAMKTVVPSLLFAVSLAAVGADKTQHSDWAVSAKLHSAFRHFIHPPTSPSQLRHSQASLSTQIQFDWQSQDNHQQFRFTPYVQHDQQDSQRSHTDIRELWWRSRHNDWQLLLGISQVFWGVTESRHLVDVINQLDALGNTGDDPKLGHAMVDIQVQQDWGTINLMLLPYFRERGFAGETGRLRPSLPISGNSQYQSTAQQHHIDTALRYSDAWGDLDVGATVFHGTSREADLRPTQNGQSLQATYRLINQAAIDIQFTQDAWLWKLETLIREGLGKTYTASVTGFEYTFYQLANSGVDLGLIVEYLYDRRDTTAPITSYQNDVFVGGRIAFNDTQDTSLLIGTMTDLNGLENRAFFEFERRLNSDWRLEFEGRFIGKAKQSSPLHGVANDDVLTLRLTRYF